MENKLDRQELMESLFGEPDRFQKTDSESAAEPPSKTAVEEIDITAIRDYGGKGYVDFFFLQDCVADNYSKVDIWCGDDSFEKSGLPATVEEYFTFIEKEMAFLEKRNQRIMAYCQKAGL